MAKQTTKEWIEEAVAESWMTEVNSAVRKQGNGQDGFHLYEVTRPNSWRKLGERWLVKSLWRAGRREETGSFYREERDGHYFK